MRPTSSPPAATASLTPLARHMQALAHAWGRMAARERRLVTLAALVVLLALIWVLLLAPALATLRQAATRQASLNQQLSHMRALQAQAQRLQQQPTIHTADALRLLQDITQPVLGAEHIHAQGHVVTVSINDVAAPALAQWLAQVRSHTGATPVQARLTHGSAGWSGGVTLHLPQESAQEGS